MYRNSTEQFVNILKENGYRLTQARSDIFNLLSDKEPQSINEIISKAKGKVDKVSIYRNVDLFEKLKIVNRINIGWKYKLELSDEFLSHHHHLICLKCEKIIDIKDEKHIEEFIKEVSNFSDFNPVRHQFEIEGYCKTCNNG